MKPKAQSRGEISQLSNEFEVNDYYLTTEFDSKFRVNSISNIFVINTLTIIEEEVKKNLNVTGTNCAIAHTVLDIEESK